jgi:curved DNA-binding protein CbpA
MDLYKELGLPHGASSEDIKRAHRKAVKEHHPDAGGDKAKFQRIQQAYDTLKDGDRRSHYDRTGETGGAQRPDPVTEAIGQIFQRMVNEMIAEGQPLETEDMRKRMKDLAGKNYNGLVEQRKAKEASLKRAETLSKRWKRKKKADGFDFMGDTIRRAQRDLTDEIRRFKEAEDIWVQAGNILDDYSYKFEKPEPVILRSGESQQFFYKVVVP